MKSKTSSTEPLVSERIPFNDLAIQWREISREALRDFDEVFAKSAFCLGPQVDAFEREIANFLGVAHAVGVNSGTSALHLAMVATDIGPGHEVLVPAHTFIATLWGVAYVGGTPVLCDVDDATGTVDLADAERRVTSRTRAIIPVHLYGQPADMDRVADFARSHNLVVVEDVAQSIGARWNGRCVGTLGAIGCFSFYPGKNMVRENATSTMRSGSTTGWTGCKRWYCGTSFAAFPAGPNSVVFSPAGTRLGLRGCPSTCRPFSTRTTYGTFS